MNGKNDLNGKTPALKVTAFSVKKLVNLVVSAVSELITTIYDFYHKYPSLISRYSRGISYVCSCVVLIQFSGRATYFDFYVCRWVRYYKRRVLRRKPNRLTRLHSTDNQRTGRQRTVVH